MCARLVMHHARGQAPGSNRTVAGDGHCFGAGRSPVLLGVRVAEFLLREDQALASPPGPQASELQKVSLLTEGMDSAACATAV